MIELQFSAGAVIYRNDGKPKFLLLRRHNGSYDLPKGHIEEGESAEMAARREIREETGLAPEFIPCFKTTTRYFFNERGKKVLKTLRLFIARTDSSFVRISYEHITYDWVDFDQAVKLLKYKNYARIMADAIAYINRWEEMEALNREYSHLPSKHDEWGLSKRFVPGEGRLDARLMLIGQAPGETEDRLARPFVGRSGKLLDSLLRRARIRRSETYITSVVQFFPPGNRLPTTREVELCSGFLKRQLAIIRPRYVLLLGNLAGKHLAGIGSVERNHGKTIVNGGITYMVTYHPAAALRFKENIEPMEKDMRRLASIMKKQ